MLLPAFMIATPALSAAAYAAIGQFEWKQVTNALPLSGLGVVLLLFFAHLSRFTGSLTVSADELSYQERGRPTIEWTWGQISSVVLFRHRASFTRRYTTSVVITGRDGAKVVIPGTTPDAGTIAALLTRRVPDRAFSL
jgi:hypothetical protein